MRGHALADIARRLTHNDVRAALERCQIEEADVRRAAAEEGIPAADGTGLEDLVLRLVKMHVTKTKCNWKSPTIPRITTELCMPPLRRSSRRAGSTRLSRRRQALSGSLERPTTAWAPAPSTVMKPTRRGKTEAATDPTTTPVTAVSADLVEQPRLAQARDSGPGGLAGGSVVDNHPMDTATEPVVIESVRLGDILSNPFRDLIRNPLRPAKLAALRRSIQSTGFWQNLDGRRVGGAVEIAYGHHRLEALRQEWGRDSNVNVHIWQLTDEEMIKRMGFENLHDWGSDAAAEFSSVRAVVEAFGHGKITLPPPPPKTRKRDLRFAPGFTTGSSAAAADHPRPYTASTVGQFLAWTKPSGEPQDKVRLALRALELIAAGHLKDADFVDLNLAEAQRLVDRVGERRPGSGQVSVSARKPAADRKPKLPADGDSSCGDRAGQLSPDAANPVLQKTSNAQPQGLQFSSEQGPLGEAVHRRVGGADPSGGDQALAVEGGLDDLAFDLAEDLAHVLDPATDARGGRLEHILARSTLVHPHAREMLVKALAALAQRAVEYGRRLAAPALAAISASLPSDPSAPKTEPTPTQPTAGLPAVPTR